MRRQTLEVTRPTQSSIAPNGEVILGTPTTITIKASVQPADRIQMEAVPQLRDYEQMFKLFSNTELFTAEASLHEADIVSIYGKDYEVVTVEPWLNGIRNHYKIMVGR